MAERNNNNLYEYDEYDNTPHHHQDAEIRVPAEEGYNNNINNPTVEKSDFQQSNPRCPPIDAEFLWKTYHRLKSTDERTQNVQ